ncbi:MAG TPA: NAD(P)H-quinone oxidoreductase [Candidatus Binatia bacterium]|nr:NAD(P)H-quinone oxidoreductase [Candidatus Binatia bacterium]
MKAIVIPKFGGADVLELREVPEPECGPEDLLVAVRATALNRADLLQRLGLYPQPGPKPEHDIPGLEYAGEVVGVGARVEGFAVGDRVMGILSGASYAEKIVTHHRLAVRVPASLSWHEAAAIPEAFITAHDALSQSGLGCGESVLVHAVGSGVGAAAVQIAGVMGATPILGTAGSADKLAAAKKLGLDVAIDYKSEDFVDATQRATAGRGADVIVDFIAAAYLERNVRALAPCGRMVVIGLLGGLRAELDLGMLLAKRASIRGTVLRARSLEEKAAATRAFEKAVLPHIASSRVRAVVDSVYPLARAADAHRYMERNANFGKIVLEV